MALSALAPTLVQRGISQKAFYLNIAFAKQVGLYFNEWLANDSKVNLLLGEWVFSHLIHPRAATRAGDDYPTTVAAALTGERFPPCELFRSARAVAERFVRTSAEQILLWQPAIVGFSTCFQQTTGALAIAREIRRRNPNVLIVFGGANCEAPMGLGLLDAFHVVDWVFSGESDLIFPEFVRWYLGDPDALGLVSELGSIRPLSPRRGWVEANPISNLDTLPGPNLDDYFDSLDAVGCADLVRPVLVYEGSRGCWWGQKHHCTFCGLNGNGMTFRSKSPSRIVNEIRRLTEKYNNNNVAAVDNILDHRLIRTAFEELPTANRDLNLFYEVKANLTGEQLTVLAAAGVRTVQPGLESLSDNILRLLRKGTSAVQNIAFLRRCKERNIRVVWNLLYGVPGEMESDYATMTRLFPYLVHLDPPSASPIRIDRFSPYFDQKTCPGFQHILPFKSYAEVFGLPQETAQKIAFYFTGVYENPASHAIISEYLDGIRRWQIEHEPAEAELGPPCLQIVQSEEYDVAIVVDTRPVFTGKPFIHLSAHQLAVLRLMRRPATVAAIEEKALRHQVRAAVEFLEHHGLIVCIGDHYVSLVCEPTLGRLFDDNRRPDDLMGYRISEQCPW